MRRALPCVEWLYWADSVEKAAVGACEVAVALAPETPRLYQLGRALGENFRDGAGESRSDAAAWCRRAAEGGCEDAKRALARLSE